MSDHDRGPYTPPSERLSFDPREPVRSGGPAPVTLIVSALILIGADRWRGVHLSGTARATRAAPAAVGAAADPDQEPRRPRDHQRGAPQP